jgi:hypothetical protein
MQTVILSKTKVNVSATWPKCSTIKQSSGAKSINPVLEVQAGGFCCVHDFLSRIPVHTSEVLGSVFTSFFGKNTL